MAKPVRSGENKGKGYCHYLPNQKWSHPKPLSFRQYLLFQKNFVNMILPAITEPLSSKREKNRISTEPAYSTLIERYTKPNLNITLYFTIVLSFLEINILINLQKMENDEQLTEYSDGIHKTGNMSALAFRGMLVKILETNNILQSKSDSIQPAKTNTIPSDDEPTLELELEIEDETL